MIFPAVAFRAASRFSPWFPACGRPRRRPRRRQSYAALPVHFVQQSINAILRKTSASLAHDILRHLQLYRNILVLDALRRQQEIRTRCANPCAVRRRAAKLSSLAALMGRHIDLNCDLAHRPCSAQLLQTIARFCRSGY